MKLTGVFLQNVLRSNLSIIHKNQTQTSICRSYKLSLQSALHDLKKEQLYIDDDRYKLII